MLSNVKDQAHQPKTVLFGIFALVILRNSRGRDISETLSFVWKDITSLKEINISKAIYSRKVFRGNFITLETFNP